MNPYLDNYPICFDQNITAVNCVLNYMRDGGKIMRGFSSSSLHHHICSLTRYSCCSNQTHTQLPSALRLFITFDIIRTIWKGQNPNAALIPNRKKSRKQTESVCDGKQPVVCLLFTGVSRFIQTFGTNMCVVLLFTSILNNQVFVLL